jgi:ATP-dependent protease HslVU (ClpYQ) peptidase subunit
MKEDLVREWNQDKQLKKGECFMIIPDRIACESQNKEQEVAES